MSLSVMINNSARANGVRLYRYFLLKITSLLARETQILVYFYANYVNTSRKRSK